MKFTGERFVPTEEGKIRLEHYHRYSTVLDIVYGKDVLDVASGEGYGSALISDVARTVTGVDMATDAIEHAVATYSDKKKLKFVQGSVTQLQFKDSSFDVVVSFETIEHLSEQEQMLSEIRRVLRDDGFLVLSSPNRPVYSEESGENNEFHVKELDFDELDALLKVQFPVTQYYGQRMMMGSVLQPMQGDFGHYQAWHDNGNAVNKKTGKMLEPVYFIAVCCMSESNIPEINPSILYPEQLDLVKHYVGFANWAKTLDKTVVKRDKKIDALSQTINDQDGQISTLTEETIQRGEWALRLDGELKEIKMKLNMVTKSNSWRLTMPLREVRRWINNPVQQTKRYAKGGLRALKLGYQSLPLSHQTKASHRHLITRFFPRILLLSGSSRTSIPSIINPPIVDNDEPLVDVEVIDAIIKLETSISPIVSVVIPVYGQVEYTIKCLKSIQNNLPKIAFEVIVIDDCSPDNSVEILQKVKGIKLLQNVENQGFIRSCNAGAKVAKGKYLCFLNNDTKVKESWLDELLRTFDEFPGTGLAGSKLVYPDGRLQEAGGIIWQDGSAWNFGRFQDPLLPIYNYAREVDYCSGASIMVPKVIFDEQGGFDEHYLPAYCEDSDLALKIRDKGYRVIYQPLSTVIHYEGITSGTDTSQGAKAYQIENSKKLFTRWQERLQAHQVPGVDADNAKDRRSTRRVLAIDHCTPTPDQDAGSVTAFNLMLLLREMDFQVTFIPEDNFLYMPEYTTALQRAGIEVLYAPHVTSVEQHLKEYENRYDLAFLFRPGVVERHLKSIRKHCPKAKVLFHTVDLHFLRMSREAELQSSKTKQKAADKMKQRELAAISATDACIVHSTVELELIQPILPDAKLHVFPLIMDIPGTNKTFADRRDIVFVGGYQHTPNVDAVHYFVTEIMPLLRKQLPGVRFYAVGSKPPADIQALASEDIIITGFVEDLTPLLDKMRVSVAPLRYGAGIKGKIGTAMAAGLPVVVTSLAVEGMSLNNGENILVADGAEDVAKTIAKLYQDEFLWNRISENGLMFADQAWGAEAAWDILSAIVADLGLNVTRNAYPLTLYSEEK